ncbi:DUF488 domain-containing protein [Staphylococcus equorum]|uniref:DUF488 domain-containing protein n=1 Tax=Staphylococcus equorum TaxID=246432 RepID=UPI000852F7CB|nr:DUF488 domain-containing protein [Staphylococcus equorum]OEK79921.1 DNA repair protein [Staphylococcus equorum]
MSEIYTIGHANHSEQQFIDMLQQFNIEVIVDVRAYRGSKRNPQFNEENMRKWLTEANIEYQYNTLLGGRRKASESVGRTINEAWNNESFHNYADYTLTKGFQEGINALEVLGDSKRVAYMCSEPHPARCHRLIVSNWLTAHKWSVHHIMLDNEQQIIQQQHELGQWGAFPIIEDDGYIVYPEIDKDN